MPISPAGSYRAGSFIEPAPLSAPIVLFITRACTPNDHPVQLSTISGHSAPFRRDPGSIHSPGRRPSRISRFEDPDELIDPPGLISLRPARVINSLVSAVSRPLSFSLRASGFRDHLSFGRLLFVPRCFSALRLNRLLALD